MTTRIYTKTGDRGATGLFGGARVAKDHLRVEAYGTVDELNAAMGLAVHASTGELKTTLQRIQHLLFELGGELATQPGKDHQCVIVDADIRWLEQQIDAAEDQLPELKNFILPGGNLCASHLHLARSICRRAERRVVSLLNTEPDTPESVIIFLNRLGDLLFVLARLANHLDGQKDVVWTARNKA